MKLQTITAKEAKSYISTAEQKHQVPQLQWQMHTADKIFI